VLAAFPLEDSHTGEVIRSTLLDLFNEWDISEEKCHAIVSDNAASMKLAMRLQE